MPGGKSKRRKWRKPSSEHSTSSDELHFTSSEEEKQGRAEMNSDKESKRAKSSEGKSGSGEGKTQDADEKEKNLFQRVSFRMSGTLKKRVNHH